MCLQISFTLILWVSSLINYCDKLVLLYIGHGLSLEHIRYNSECDVYEELEPIDINLKYDFDYQQFIHLRHEVLVKPVSSTCVIFMHGSTLFSLSLHLGRYNSTEVLLQN